MSTPMRLGVFVLGLLLVFTAAVGIGRATGPVGPVGPVEEGRQVHAGDDHAGDDHAGDDRAHGDEADPQGVADLPGGLATSQDGYTLVLAQTTYRPGARELAFRVEDAAGTPVTDYEVEHDKRLHLVVVRRDFSGFQHVHPTLDPSGTWRVPVDLTPGAWRVLADFVPAEGLRGGGDKVVLGADVAVPGPTDLAPRGPVTRTATVDGYTVTLGGDLVAGQHSALTLTVERDGAPVTDLEPYLGARGHLVALREGDLAYLHVHPEDTPEDAPDGAAGGPTVEFTAEVPSAGRYHVYLDFRHDGVVRTAAFTTEATR